MGTSLQVLVPAVLHLKEGRGGKISSSRRRPFVLRNLGSRLLFEFSTERRDDLVVGIDSPVLGKVHRDREVSEIVQSALPSGEPDVSTPVLSAKTKASVGKRKNVIEPGRLTARSSEGGGRRRSRGQISFARKGRRLAKRGRSALTLSP